jgi:hypothetical protein
MKEPIRARHYFVTISTVSILIVILMLIFSASIPPRSIPQRNLPSDAWNLPEKRGEALVNPNSLVSVTTEPDGSQTSQQPDGSSLLQRHCTQCHMAQWLEGVQKSLPEWEATLARMERNGVLLSETEKNILLDYLATTDDS